MKKALLTLALVVTSVAAFAQGKVQFVNDATRSFNLGTTAAGDVAGPIAAGPLPSGNTLVAALYGITGNNGATLNLVTAIPLTGTSVGSPGRMASKSLILSGIPGATVASFGIVISDVAVADHPASISGTLLARNVADNIPAVVPGFDRPELTYFGTSGLFTAIPGTSTITYPPIYATTAPPGGVSSTWVAGTVYVNAIPEPSTFALAGLGAAALLIFRRRK